MIIGFILIVIGLLFLGINFGYINPEVWPSLWRFWPAILILFGVVMLARRFMPKKVSVVLVVAILALVTVGAVVVAGGIESHEKVGGDSGEQSNTINIDEPLSSNLEKLNIDIRLGAQDLRIASLKSGLIAGQVNTVGGSPKYSLSTEGNTANFKATQKWSVANWFNRNGKSKSQSQIDISNQITTNVYLSMGASKIDADFSDILLTRLVLKTGAINGKIKIGLRQANTNIDINTGASDVTISVPASSGLEVTNKSGVTKIKYDKISMETNAGDKAKSSGFDTKSQKVYVDIKAGASSITFIGY